MCSVFVLFIFSFLLSDLHYDRLGTFAAQRHIFGDIEELIIHKIAPPSRQRTRG